MIVTVFIHFLEILKGLYLNELVGEEVFSSEDMEDVNGKRMWVEKEWERGMDINGERYWAPCPML